MYMIRPIAMFLIKFHDLNKCTTSYCDVKRHLAPGLDFQSSKVHSRYIDQIYRTLTRQHFSVCNCNTNARNADPAPVTIQVKYWDPKLFFVLPGSIPNMCVNF